MRRLLAVVFTLICSFASPAFSADLSVTLEYIMEENEFVLPGEKTCHIRMTVLNNTDSNFLGGFTLELIWKGHRITHNRYEEKVDIDLFGLDGGELRPGDKAKSRLSATLVEATDIEESQIKPHGPKHDVNSISCDKLASYGKPRMFIRQCRWSTPRECNADVTTIAFTAPPPGTVWDPEEALRAAVRAGTFSGSVDNQPFTVSNIEFTSKTKFRAVLTWATLGAIHKIEGWLAKGEMYYKEVGYIKKGRAKLCQYQVPLRIKNQPNPGTLIGLYSFCGPGLFPLHQYEFIITLAK